jgi:glucan 1,3-beta-glucosidase
MALGLTLIVTTLIATETALGFTFDPRYRDFPFAPLTAAVLPFVLLRWRMATGARALAETVAAIVLALCAVFVVWNETLANWQALWFAAALALTAFSLLRARVAPG